MVLCFKCEPTTKRKLDALVSTGAYPDLSEAICAAIENLVLLTAEVDRNGILAVGTGADAPAAVALKKYRQPAEGDSGTSELQLLDLGSLGEQPKNFATLPGDVFFPGQEVPVDRWIFGQFSKLLPAKASVRALANLQLSSANGLELDRVATRVAQVAETLGRNLVARDLISGLGRDEAWAVGFPSGDQKADRSRLRYANQFVAAIGKQGSLTGLLVDLKFINLSRTRSKHILLTRPGWDFALLPNPVLDGGGGEAKFSGEEVQFFLDHVRTNVPVEDFAFRTILGAIKQGEDTPDLLDQVCSRHLPNKRKAELSPAVITTQRTGVVSRLADLGLLVRRREGVRVSYLITDRGLEYFSTSVAA